MEKNFNLENMEQTQTNNKEKSFYYSEWFNQAMDIVRIGLLICAIIIIVELVTNINEVKILSSDVCALCQNFSGAICWYPSNLN